MMPESALNYWGEKWRSVSVPLGCHLRLSQMKWLLNNRSLFLTVLEAGMPKVKTPAGQVSHGDKLPGSSFPCVLTGKKGQGHQSHS